MLTAMLAGSAVVVAVFGGLSPEGWWQGHSYGNRFAVDIVPMLAILAIPAIDRVVRTPRTWQPTLVAGLVVWSLFVHAQGALIKETACFNVDPTDIDVDRGRLWSIDDAQPFRGVSWILEGHSPLAVSCTV